jgi:peptide/nickel transport system permease protein
MLGFGIVSALVAMAVLAPIIIPYPQDAYVAMHPENALMPVSFQHPFGTDELGRDLFSRCIYGSRISLQVGVVVILIATITGVVLGGFSGYYGGIIDQAIMRLTDSFLSIPSLILALAVAATLGPGLNNAMAAIAVTWWPWYARLVRGQVLEIKQESYVEAARAMGGSKVYIIFKHIMPNALGPILVNASMDIGFAILTAASLGFLGLGAQAPTPEWGLIIGTGRKYLPTEWWYTTFPGLMIFLSVLGFNLLGDGLRDLLDPRTRRKGRVKK